MSQIELVIDGRHKDLGGFEVERVLPYAPRRMVGPFIFFDHMGPAEFQPGFPTTVDVRPHPHIGLSTLTYLFDGEITHRDSLGAHQPIRPGEVNWMTAGRGITHSERFERHRAEGGLMHGIQAWVALPEHEAECEPEFEHYEEADAPSYQSGGLHARLVAGSAFGATSPVKVRSPLFYVHWRLAAGALAGLPPEYPERAAYVVSGTVEIDGQTIEAGRMAVFAPGQTIEFRAVTDAEIMLLGGEPVGPRLIEWNFVASTRERLEAAKDDWRAGRFPLPVGDDAEFIPLPEPAPPPNPMS